MPDFLPGDRLNISASEWNRMRRMLRIFEQTNGNGILGGGPVKAANPGPLWVQNTTAADIDAFNVIGLDEPLFDPATVEGEQFNGVRMKGVTPDAADHANAFAVIQEPATKDGGFARAIASGHTWALVNVTDTAHNYANVANTTTVLQSSLERGAVRILHNPGGTTGTKLCPVTILPTVRLFRGVVSEVGGILGSTSGDVLLTSPNKTESVFNPFAVTIGEDEPVLVGDVDGQLTMWYPGEGTTGGATDRIFVEFELTEDMDATTALQASAKVLDAVGTGAPAVDAAITVHDSTTSFSDCISGAKGLAINWGTSASPEYHIVHVSRVAVRLRFTATAPICATDNGDVTASLGTKTLIRLGHFTDDPGTNFVVTNPAKHAAWQEASSGDMVWVERMDWLKDGSGKWQYQIYKVEKHSVTVPTEFRVNTDGLGVKTLQWRGVKAAIEYCDAETDWEDIFTPTEESVVIGGSYDDTTHQYKLTRKKVWVFASDTQTDHVLHTLTARSVVIENDINGFAFRYTPMTIYVAEQDTAGTPVTYHTGVDCA